MSVVGTLTVFYNNSKAKRIINLDEKFFKSQMGESLSAHIIEEKAKGLATDLSEGQYLSHSLNYDKGAIYELFK